MGGEQEVVRHKEGDRPAQVNPICLACERYVQSIIYDERGMMDGA
jgi:hypothetical protein